MNAPTQLSIAKDFSRFPAGRYDSDGPHSGQRFRRVLSNALRTSGSVMVLLDGTMGYGSSFLEECFGGLVREEKFSASELHERLSLSASDQSLIDEVWSYIDRAKLK